MVSSEKDGRTMLRILNISSSYSNEILVLPAQLSNALSGCTLFPRWYSP